MTWLLVRTRPDDEITMPVPAASPPPASVVVMSTTAGVTRSAMLATSELELDCPLGVRIGCDAKPAEGDCDDVASCSPIPTPMLATRPITSATAKRDTRRRLGGSAGGGPMGNPYCGGAGGSGGGPGGGGGGGAAPQPTGTASGTRAGVAAGGVGAASLSFDMR